MSSCGRLFGSGLAFLHAADRPPRFVNRREGTTPRYIVCVCAIVWLLLYRRSFSTSDGNLHKRCLFVFRFSELDDELVAANCVLLYPSPEATDIRDLPPVGSGPSPTPPYTIIILDGTWRQARSIYSGSPPLHTLRKV